MMIPTIDQRLAQLPPKVSAPFRQLLNVGQIPEEIIHIVLDAGEMAGDQSKLIGFTAGYYHMRGQGIPIHDVIDMAKKQNRRINLTWSPTRWKEEHERLSRAEAMRRLAGENVQYDLEKYRKHLPSRFPGYLIGTSRRLGMEGLRQRHCVATYHDRLMKGTCAIAAVFVEKRRWTVQLELTEAPETPLSITQIKTRYNALPPASIRSEIHELLGIPLPVPGASTPANTEHNSLYFENLRRVLPILRDHRIESVTVTFDGSGDSGSIDDIHFAPAANADTIRDATIEHLATGSVFDDGQWRTAQTPQTATVYEAIEALTYDYLEETGINWYDNDGGFGNLEIDVANASVTLEINQRYTESTSEFYAEHNIETGEEL